MEQCLQSDGGLSPAGRDLLNTLAQALETHQGRLRIILVTRADALGVLRDSPLQRWLTDPDSIFRIGPISADAFQGFLVATLRLAGVVMEPGLERRISGDRTRENASFATMAMILRILYERRNVSVITHAAYEWSGGIAGLMAARMERVLTPLDPARRDLALRLLATLTDMRSLKCRSRPIIDIVQATDSQPMTAELFRLLRREGLIVVDGDSQAGLGAPSLAESKLLQAWIAENSGELRLRDELETSAETWVRNGSASDFLPDKATVTRFKGVKTPSKVAREYLYAAHIHHAGHQRLLIRKVLALVACVVLFAAGLVVQTMRLSMLSNRLTIAREEARIATIGLTNSNQQLMGKILSLERTNAILLLALADAREIGVSANSLQLEKMRLTTLIEQSNKVFQERLAAVNSEREKVATVADDLRLELTTTREALGRELQAGTERDQKINEARAALIEIRRTLGGKAEEHDLSRIRELADTLLRGLATDVGDPAGDRFQRINAILVELVDDPDPVKVGEKSTYTIRVTNQGGGTDLHDVAVLASFPDGLSPFAASNNGGIAGGEVTWRPLPILGLRQSITYSVNAKAKAEGDHRVEIRVTSRDRPEPIIETESTTVYGESLRGVSAVLVELVDDPDPIAVGEEVTYTARVTNQGGAQALTEVAIQMIFPGQLKPMRASNNARIDGKTVIWPTVANLPLKQSITFTVKGLGITAGDARVKCQVTIRDRILPITEVESTTVY
jgi:hypothetical protein